MCNSAGVQGGTNRSATNIRDKEKNQEKEEGGGGVQLDDNVACLPQTQLIGSNHNISTRTSKEGPLAVSRATSSKGCYLRRKLLKSLLRKNISWWCLVSMDPTKRLRKTINKLKGQGRQRMKSVRTNELEGLREVPILAE